MAFAESRVTAQGQISVPAEVRKRLGVGPGSILEWDEADGEVVIRRRGTSSTNDLHRAAFPEGAPARRTLAELKAGLRAHAVARHARR